MAPPCRQGGRGGRGGGCNPASMAQSAASVTTTCCAGEGIDCSMGVPSDCTAECAPIYLDFMEDCGDMLAQTPLVGPQYTALQEKCQAVAPGGDKDGLSETGGSDACNMNSAVSIMMVCARTVSQLGQGGRGGGDVDPCRTPCYTMLQPFAARPLHLLPALSKSAIRQEMFLVLWDCLPPVPRQDSLVANCAQGPSLIRAFAWPHRRVPDDAHHDLHALCKPHDSRLHLGCILPRVPANDCADRPQLLSWLNAATRHRWLSRRLALPSPGIRGRATSARSAPPAPCAPTVPHTSSNPQAPTAGLLAAVFE